MRDEVYVPLRHQLSCCQNEFEGPIRPPVSTFFSLNYMRTRRPRRWPFALDATCLRRPHWPITMPTNNYQGPDKPRTRPT